LSVLPDANATNMSIGVKVMCGSLPSIRFILLVGIGGGIPRPEDPLRDIRLGDIIVSAPEGMALQVRFCDTSTSNVRLFDYVVKVSVRSLLLDHPNASAVASRLCRSDTQSHCNSR
jgi:hypothetical protein